MTTNDAQNQALVNSCPVYFSMHYYLGIDTRTLFF